ncbi:hypothetical protein C0J52_05044 [Blattella germanica]|nr:hypothetical protein C0J52_05044 [Blattella germanica]
MESAMFSTDDMEFSSTPPDIIEEASNVVNNLLPVKSKKKSVGYNGKKRSEGIFHR